MYHAFVLLATSHQMRMLTSTHVHHWRKWETIVIDQPMPDVPKNTTHPTSDGFESDSDSGNGALAQPFQVQRSCPGTFFFFIIHSLCLENQRKGNKQGFFFFFGNSRALRGMEEIDPRAFNNGAEDSGLPISHTYINDGSNSKLYPSSKKARKSLSNLDAKVCLLL